MIVTVYHRKNGTFAAEIPTEEGNIVVFSYPYDHDPGHSDHYDVLRNVIRDAYGLILPPLSKTHLIDPGEEKLDVEAVGQITA